MKRRLISIFIILSMLLVTIPVAVWADGITTFDELQGAINGAADNTPTTISLGGNIQDMTASLTIPSGKDITIDLNGCVIDAGEALYSVITVGSGAKLTITDSNTSVSHTGYNDGNSLWHLDENNEHELTAGEELKVIAGGIITGGYETDDGETYGGAVLNKGELTMNGGTIAGCSVTYAGGAVFVDVDASFVMSGGMITGNVATNNDGYGGAVYVSKNSTFTLSNQGCISENKASLGGAVFVEGKQNEYTGNGGRFFMQGGVIKANRSNGHGAGVCLDYALEDACFTMTGGTITENISGVNGAGIYVCNDTKVVLGGTAKIAQNFYCTNDHEKYLISDSNVYLEENNGDQSVITFSEAGPLDGMFIGISTKTVPEDASPVAFSENGDADFGKYFFSDDPNYYVSQLTLACEADEQKYDVWVHGRQITEHNKADVLHDSIFNDGTSSVSFSSDNSTLILQNANIADFGVAAGLDDDEYAFSGIKSGISSLVIEFKGINTIGNYIEDSNSERPWKEFSLDYGIYSPDGEIIFTSNGGTLTIYDYIAGIKANKLKTEKFSGKLLVRDSGGVLYSPDAEEPPCAIRVQQDVTINGGTFDLTSFYSNGIFSSEGNVSLANTTLSIDAGAKGIYSASNLTIENSTVSIKSGANEGDYACYGNLAIDNNLEIKNANETYEKGVTNQLTSKDGGYVIISPKKISYSNAGNILYIVNSLNSVNGTFSVDKANAPAGSTVTINVAPDKGFTLGTLVVIGKNGKEIELKNLGDNKYSFTMPSSAVEISASFMEDNTMLNFCVDVKVDSPYYDAVKWAYENGFTNGKDAVHFDPQGSATRGQMITLLWRMAGSPVFEDDQVVFNDIKSEDYFYNAVIWAWNVGIINGKTENIFAANDLASRAEVVTFIYRYAKVAGGDLPNPFTDINKNEFYYYPVVWAANNGITAGTSASTFALSADCTRGQIVTFLYRYNNKYN